MDLYLPIWFPRKREPRYDDGLFEISPTHTSWKGDRANGITPTGSLGMVSGRVGLIVLIERSVMTQIVSLLPSATEIVHALGMGRYLVGRSHSCDFPATVKALPVCTAPKFPVCGSSRDIDEQVKKTLHEAVSVYDVFEEVLEKLQPTHIVAQSQCEVCAVSLKDVERVVCEQVSSHPKIISLEADTLLEVWDDILSVADSLGIGNQGGELVEKLKQRSTGISDIASTAENRPRVACIEWIEPLIAAGNWMPELVEMAGGENLVGEAGKHSGYMSWGDLLEADPDILILLPCGFDMQRALDEMYWLTDRPDWDSLRAARDHQIYVTDGNQYFNRPGPRLAESLQILGEIIHPELFQPDFEGKAWKQVT